MNANPLIQKLKPFHRKLVITLAALALVAGGAVVYWQFFTDPPPTWVARWRISRYLKKQSDKSNFKIDFRFPTRQQMARAPGSTTAPSNLLTGALTGKDFEALRNQYLALERSVLGLERDIADQQRTLEQRRERLQSQDPPASATPATAGETNASPRPGRANNIRNGIASLEKNLAAKQQALEAKNKELAPIVSDLWAFQRVWAAQREAVEATGTSELAGALRELMSDMRASFEEADSYPRIYALIGQELWVARRLFSSANPQHRLAALSLARQAGKDALNYAENGWLASRICEAYVWPSLDLVAKPGPGAATTLEILLNECADIFRRSDETQSLIRNYHLLLAKTANPQRADMARVELAFVHERAGDYAQALHYLKEVKRTNDFARPLRRIPWLEQQVKAKR